MSNQPASHRLAYALIFITPALWCVNYLVARWAPGVVEPNTLAFGRWLVAGLTFQLAADVIETATTSTADGWYDIGRLAAVAVIRTFLSFFLERDMRAMSEAPTEPAPKA